MERRERSSRGDDDRGRGRDDDRGSRRGRDDDRGGRRSSGFSYRQRDAESVKKRADSSGKDYDRYLEDVVPAFTVGDGDNMIRFLPPTWDDAEHFGFDIYVHYSVGPDKGTYLCLNKMKGEKCPICEERKRAVNQGDEKYAKDLEPKKRVLTYVIDRKKEKEGLKVWAMPWTLDRDIVKVSVDKRSGDVLPIDHPEDGYDVMFERHGKADRTEYVGVAIDRRASPLDNDDALDLAVEHPLPTLLKFYSYDHIASVFDGGGSPSKDDDGARDSRGPSRDRGAGSRASRDEDADDDRDSDRGGRSDRSGRDKDRGSEDSLTWEQVHEMNYDELCDLIETQRLDINPDKSKNDEDLADWICEEMKIKKEEPRRSSRDDDDAGSASDRLARMRRR